MPTSNTNGSPVKRPGLGRRAVSSHAVVTRSTSSNNTTGDLSDAQSTTSHAQAQQKPHYVHRHHHPRPHLVGGGHRYQHHSRNPSFGKNVNKLQRIASGTESGRHHQRKKSAPATPAASPPRGGGHVHWDGALEDSHPNESMKKNNSSPALRRYTTSSGITGKKALVTDRPRSSSGKKKTVGFELGDSDNDDGEWEDTTQSPESTRRSSVAQPKGSVENTAALVDPLVFVKRPYPQIPRATSLPEPTSKTFAQEGQSTDEEEGKQHPQEPQPQQQQEEQQQPEQEQEQQNLHESKQRQENGQALEPSDIASRLLSPSLSAKAPPAMSSISALAKPEYSDLSRKPSLTTLASGQDGSRRTVSSSIPPLANTPGNQTQATSSSIEGGVSRFIVNNRPSTQTSASRADSDPYTPSSFLPHYHPQTPPSPGHASVSRKPRASPPSRPPGIEPPSRTQQKLWLQRTAALNTSPPDSHASATVSPSTIDPAFMAAARPGSGAYDATRGLANGTARSGGPGHDSEAKQTRKAYEKTALELAVVRRFQSPTADSFNRLRTVIQEAKPPSLSFGQPVKSAPSLTMLHDGQQPGYQTDSGHEPRQLIGRRMPDSRPSVYLQDPDDSSANVSDAGDRQRSQHPSQRILSTSDDTAQGNPSADEDAESNECNDSEMMIRRMWESRIVATSA